MTQQHDHFADSIIRAAYDAVAGNDASAEHRITILVHEHHQDQMKVLDAIAKALNSLNGGGRTRGEKVKAHALPVGGGMGFMAIVFEVLRVVA